MDSLSKLGPSLQKILVRVLLHLHTLLSEFKSELESCYEKDGEDVKRWKFALIRKRGLDRYQKQIDDWSERLTRRLLLRGLAMNVEAEAQARAERQEKKTPEVQIQARQTIPAIAALLPTPQEHSIKSIGGSSAFLASLSDGTVVLVEYKYFGKDASVKEKMFTKRSVRDIATMLCEANARIGRIPGTGAGGILKCLGYFEDEARFRYGVVSQLPSPWSGAPQRPLRSLRDLLWSPENAKGSRHNLNDRVALARSIASAVLEIHAAHFVHKSIRPSNILVFDPDTPDSKGYPYAIGRPAVIGFEQTRPDWEESERLSSGVWEEDIYRHPDRQGLKSRVPYSILHDIYSLGVVFIEIALWRSAVSHDRQRDPPLLVHNRQFWGSLYTTRCQEQDPAKTKALYQKLARSVIPQTIGGRFASVIEACLTCVEGGFGEVEDGRDNDGADEVAYLEKVVESLEAICL
ncbi:hypothetical protein CONLIGDRAFT_675352 [Coniochaeta ligniaria NRRL 30616]|uniref:Protein kinase domain-containing protein n=1 Tax=Coniochaeta ligniaria NRRL 30616 TaxID=1408157 RepID=A0A1J7K2I7_9PEZI|nr:hypothetical protein CONLIGDRAFT_675352 [Coniochaeta ligniaria NRRL 30616]